MMVRAFAGLMVIASLLLSGCVTETLYANTDKPVPDMKRENNDAATARVSLGMKYLQSGNMEMAKANLVKALELAPDLPAANYAQAFYYQTVQEEGLALDYYRRATELSPDDGNIRNGYGAYLCQLGQYDEADQQFIAAVQSKSYTKAAETYENMGLCAKQAGRLDKAKEYFERSLAHSALRPRALLELTSSALDVENVEDAERYLTTFHKTYTPSAESAYLGVRLANLLHDPLMMQKYGDILTHKFPASKEAEQYMLDQF